jgi:DNA topoisomerase IA
MEWLVLTENQEKAVAFRRAIPNIIAISTKGNPWEIEIELDSSSLTHIILAKPSHKDVIAKIKNTARSVDRVILAFDQTSLGEAIAVECEKLIPNKCCRWSPHSLNLKEIKNGVATLEGALLKEIPKCNHGLAQSHWVQAIMDITWTTKINQWIKRETNENIKITRLMALLLKTVSQEEKLSKLNRPSKYWTISTDLRCTRISKDKIKKQHINLKGEIIVPTFKQLNGGVPNKTRDILRERIEDSKSSAVEGDSIAQPEPGKAWRYGDWEGVVLQKNHIKRFPYFVVESTINQEINEEILPPLTNWEISKLAEQQSKGDHKEIQIALSTLYHNGLITNPKSNNPNLFKKTIEELNKFCKSRGIEIDEVGRSFSYEDSISATRKKNTEAIRPAQWERLPDDIDSLMPIGENRDLCCWLYRQIYLRAIQSQKKVEKIENNKVFLYGPLYLTRQQAQEQAGRPFFVEQENDLHIHMNVIIGADTDEQFKHGEVMEVVNTQIFDHSTREERILTEEVLFGVLSNEEGLAKRETVRNLLKVVVSLGFITINKKREIQLTEKGLKITSMLNKNFGQFLDKNYHKTIVDNLNKIEDNRLDSEEFIQRWWECLRTFLSTDIYYRKNSSSTSVIPHPKDNDNSNNDDNDTSSYTDALSGVM